MYRLLSKRTYDTGFILSVEQRIIKRKKISVVTLALPSPEWENKLFPEFAPASFYVPNSTSHNLMEAPILQYTPSTALQHSSTPRQHEIVTQYNKYNKFTPQLQ